VANGRYKILLAMFLSTISPVKYILVRKFLWKFFGVTFLQIMEKLQKLQKLEPA